MYLCAFVLEGGMGKDTMGAKAYNARTPFYTKECDSRKRRVT